MLRTIYGKLVLALTVLLVGILVVQIAVTMGATQAYVDEANQRLYRDLAAKILVEQIAADADMTRVPVLESEFNAIMHLNPALELYLLDPEGRLLAFSAPEGHVRLDRVAIEPIHEFLSEDPMFPIRGDDPREPEQRKIFSAAPITLEGDMRGYLYVILGGERYRSILDVIRGSHIAQLSLRSLAAVFVFALIAGLLLFRSITRRLTLLTQRMEAFQRGNGEVGGSGLGTGDEIDRLTGAFEELSGRVRRQVESLQELDSLRRELVANVSHDLRTPLSSLRGYLETLQVMEHELSPEERQRYLEAAARHTSRLSRLVDDLFELAKLESGGIELAREPFELGELLQDVVQKFELEARQRGVSLVADREADVPLAEGDIGLLERVLENLIDNALRHTPEGGEIRLTLSFEGAAHRIEVSDTGRGIPAERLPRIFDRFYRVERDADGRSEGMGLGLAITRRILELHGATIEAESTPGRGTTFRITLPGTRE